MRDAPERGHWLLIVLHKSFGVYHKPADGKDELGCFLIDIEQVFHAPVGHQRQLTLKIRV